ncbi:O-antigen polymerase [Lactiplantibacillus fabifermentans]|uniref:O-antigen polymerase n=1 Tax=Lactiplantibacillus fabifermentans TaxID=483011 RepID=UPI00155A5D3C|nr:O-antigen polymerase [Lactiplantibacillus fabifermentans]
MSLLFLFWKKQINLLNPIVLYCVIWGGMVALYVLPIFTNFPELTLKSWVLILGAGISFVLGALFGMASFRNKISKKSILYSYSTLETFLLFLLLIIVSAYILTILKLGIPPLLGGSLARVNYYVSYIEPAYLLIFPFWFGCLFLIKQKYHVRFNIILIFFSLILTLTKGNKFPLIFLIGLIIYFTSINKNLKVKYLVYTLVVVVGVFVLSSLFITKSTSAVVQIQNTLLGVSIPSYLHFIIDPILYLTNNLMNVNNFWNADVHHSFGIQQFSGIVHDAGLNSLIAKVISDNNQIWSGSLQYSWLTTGTYLKTLYLDFGTIGVLVVPFIYGVVCGAIYNQLSNGGMNLSLTSLYVGYLLFLSLLLSFFTNYFSENGVLYNLLAVMLMDQVSRGRYETDG